MCVYDSWRVLIKVSHLPHNRTLSLCTCLLSYVHCGLSTSPAVRTQPQIRAVYLTTAASSPVYKHTQTSLLLCFSLTFFSCRCSSKCCKLRHAVVSRCSSGLVLFFPECMKPPKNLAMDVFMKVYANTRKTCKNLQAHSHSLDACADKQPQKLQETNTHTKQEMHVRNPLTQSPHMLFDMGKSMLEFKLAKQSCIQRLFGVLLIDSCLLPCTCHSHRTCCWV